MFKEERGFTLIELLVVIVIVAILAGLTFPQFSKTKEHAIGKEAKANLKLIGAAEKIYRIESANQAYFSCQCLCSGTGATCCDNTTDGCNYFLKLSLTPSNWTYWATATGGGASATCTASADRVNTAPSPYRDCVYSLAHNDADGEPNPNNATWCP